MSSSEGTTEPFHDRHDWPMRSAPRKATTAVLASLSSYTSTNSALFILASSLDAVPIPIDTHRLIVQQKERMTLALRSPFDHWMSSVAFHVASLAHCASPLGIR